jgi:hypothetical protein
MIPALRSERVSCATCGHPVRHVDGQPSARHLASQRHQRALLVEASPANDGPRIPSWPPAANDATAVAAAPANDAPVVTAEVLDRMRAGVAELGAEQEGRAA